MRLDRLHLQNFRCYEDAHFDFNPHFNLIVGVNGSGKTSLLQGVATSFLAFQSSLKDSKASFNKEDQRFVIDKFDGKTRLERKFPLRITGNGQFLGVDTWPSLMSPGTPLCSMMPDQTGLITEHLDTATDLPVLAFYRTHRRLKASGITAEQAAQQRNSRLDGYSNWYDAVTHLEEFESWLISRTLERMQNLLDAGSAHTNVDDELAWVNEALNKALPQAQNLRYDLRVQSLLVDISEGQTVLFNELSDGQRSFIVLIVDIARRMCLLNPQLGREVLKKTQGIVIIDELDMHLHPAWQRHIVTALRTAFPQVQFIAASHSPQVIGSLKPEEVIILNSGKAYHPRVTYGLDSSSVLEEVMGVPERDLEVEKLLNELFSTLEDNDITKAKQQLQSLKAKAPDLPEFAGAEALLKRKEILGK